LNPAGPSAAHPSGAKQAFFLTSKKAIETVAFSAIMYYKVLAWIGSKMDRRRSLGLFAALPLAIASRAFASAPIDEETYVQIGGIAQWVTIKGRDAANPAVLFLHGGPGDALSPYADDTFAGWEKDFTLVQWDQRGAGRTFGKNDPAIEETMTVERMVQDGIELAEYLTRHLHKKKIILVGGSWGSVLGTNMVHARPDLFYAYIGQAQIVDWWANASASYARLLELAQAAQDREAIAALTDIGPPPWHALSQWAKYRKVEQPYQEKLAPTHNYAISPAYASAAERAQYRAADDATFVHFVGLDFNGPLTKVNLRTLGSDFALPFFIVQGTEDLTAIPAVAKSYFDGINAPQKQFYTVPATGHEPSPASMSLTRKILTERVLPLVRDR
jgi:pimeloyl-ACP methyl ester carboxylesterase